MIVAKFGESSLSDAVQVRKVFEIIKENPSRKVIVVSAPGKRGKNDLKVTDMLIKCADMILAGADPSEYLSPLLGRYESIVKDLGLKRCVYGQIEDDITSRLGARNNGGMSDSEFYDSVKAAGEDNCAKFVSAFFNSEGLPAVYVSPKSAGFYLSDHFGDAQVLPGSYNNIKEKLGAIEGTVVFPGFFGVTRADKVITFSRGGSDVTGSVLAAALDAELYENFTDVDHVYAVDPGLVKDPLPIKELTYREMRELSYGGFKVYHEDALVPVFSKGIPIWIKNTNNPSSGGTTILAARTAEKGKPVTGISSASGFLCININKLLMNTQVGYGRKVLSIIEDENLPFEHMPSGIDNISVILRETVATQDKVNRITRRIMGELDVDDISVRRGLSIVMLVGEGMLNTVGTSARACRAFAHSNINIEIINQGASEVSIMFGVDEKDADRAVAGLYHEFFT